VEGVKLFRNERKKCPGYPAGWDVKHGKKGEDYDSTVLAFICTVKVKPKSEKKSKVVKDCDDTLPRSLVLDIPDQEYVDRLHACDRLTTIDKLETVFHFSPPEVVASTSYRRWMEKVGGKVTHILLNENCRDLGLPETMSHTHKLRMIKGELFPACAGAADNSADAVNEVMNSMNKAGVNNTVVNAVTGLRVNVWPNYLWKMDSRKVVRRFDEEISTRELTEGKHISDKERRGEYVELMKKDLEAAMRVEVPALDRRTYPVITFLGTGATLPNKYRNVSGILVETEPGSFLILDCGEGTMGQLLRLKGKEEAEVVLLGLKGVYISHSHADHHMGLFSIIQSREKAFRLRGRQVNTLYIICSESMAAYLVDYHAMYEPILSHTELLRCEDLMLGVRRTVKDLPELGLVELVTSRALHCDNSFCLAIRTSSGYKLAYSGDTRPYQLFLDICVHGGGPDLLIHEATMEHARRYDALIKRHSTFTEAIEVGQAVGAKFTILTHFSLLYAKMPSMLEIQGKLNVGIAFDNMVVNPSTIHLIPSIYPALTRFLSDNQEELVENVEKYKLKNVERGSITKHLNFENSQSSAEKKQLADKFVEKNEVKHQWLMKVNRRKVLMRQLGDETDNSKARK